MSDFSKCKICRFELGHDEGWGSQICDSCEQEIELDDYHADLESLNDDDDHDLNGDLGFHQQWSDVEVIRGGHPIGVEKRQEPAHNV